MNSFESIKAVLYRKEDLKYSIAEEIIKKSAIKLKLIIEYFSDEDLTVKLAGLKREIRFKGSFDFKNIYGEKISEMPRLSECYLL